MARYKYEPNYIAKQSILPAFKWWRILFFWLVIPLISLIAHIIRLKCTYIEFYDSYYIKKWGVFVKRTQKVIFPKITSISTTKYILGHGDVHIDTVGKIGDEVFEKISHPDDLRDFLEYNMLSESAIENFSNNPYLVDDVFPTSAG